ncbi:MAG: hypothetical protein AAGE65_03470 [Planctomycetota bacterium]
MKPTSFTVGPDFYPGTRGLSATKRVGRYYNARREGAITPERQEQIADDRIPVSGTISSMSAQLLNLVGTQAASATIAGVDALTGNAVTVTITNPSFSEFTGNPTETEPGLSRVSFEATDIAFA